MKINLYLLRHCVIGLILLALPAVVQAQFIFTTNNGSITITGYTGPGSVLIPAETNGYTVTGIGGDAFAYSTSLTSITIPGSVTTIGGFAFAYCSNLTVAYFEGNAPPDVGNAFYGDPDAVAYYEAGSNGWGSTFGGAPTEETTPVSDFDYRLSDGQIIIEGYNGRSGALVLPAEINGYPVTIIGEGGAQGLSPNLTSVIIPDTVTNISNGAFGACGLTNVTIPGSVINMGGFGNCMYLTNVVIEDGVISIAESTFMNCSGLSSISIPNSVTTIGSFAFQGCPLSSITIPGSVTTIGEGAFLECGYLTTAYFEGNAPSDDGTAFSGDPATVYYLPGTTGWGPTFGSAPTKLWNPQAIAFTTAGGQFGFSITGPTNATIVVEACANLANPVWLPVSTNTLSGSGTSSFSDPQSANYPNRYYRFSAP